MHVASIENSLLYLDPHTIQPTVPAPTSPDEIISDRSYHCDQADRMPLADLDPSLALVSTDRKTIYFGVAKTKKEIDLSTEI